MAKAWYKYPFDSGFGTYPDPLPGANYPKPDANFSGIPNGTPITALASGTVTGARAQPWGPEAYSITVKLDKPLNSVATHMAYNYVGKPQVSVGQRVGVGTTLAPSGNPYGIGTAFALIDTDVYGTGSKNEPFSGTYVNPALSPVSFLKSIQGGNVSGDIITVTDFMDEVVDTMSGHPGHDPNIYNFMIAWAQKEGGGITNNAAFNPLNTKQQAAGSTDAGHGIQAYPDDGTGIKATIAALNNGLYGALVHALNTDDLIGLGFNSANNQKLHQMANNIAAELMVWAYGHSSLTDSNYEGYVLDIMQLAGISNASIQGGNVESSKTGQSQAAIDAYGQKSLGPDASGLTVQGAEQNASNALNGLNNFFSALQGFFSNPVRLIKILGGAALVIVGLVLLVRSLMPGVSIGGKA